VHHSYDTTASVLHFAVHALAVLPEVQDRVRAEVVGVLGESEEGEGGDDDEQGQVVVTNEQLRQMCYLKAVVQETLRLYPPAPKWLFVLVFI
jgi:cytochrome P450